MYVRKNFPNTNKSNLRLEMINNPTHHVPLTYFRTRGRTIIEYSLSLPLFKH